MNHIQEALRRLQRVKSGENPIDVYGTRERTEGVTQDGWNLYWAEEYAKYWMADDRETLADEYIRTATDGMLSESPGANHPLTEMIEAGWEYIGGGGYKLPCYTQEPVSDAQLYEFCKQNGTPELLAILWPNGIDLTPSQDTRQKMQ